MEWSFRHLQPRAGMARRRYPILAALAIPVLAVPMELDAQSGSLAGRVVRAGTGDPIRDVRIAVVATGQTVYTGANGAFSLSGLAPGALEIRVTRIGFEPLARQVRVIVGTPTRIDLELEPLPVQLAGVEVSVLRPDLRPEGELEQQEIREANPRDAGELLRTLDGVNAVRRGPVGLDPVVRGLRETEVGVYLDGTRMFPAGPARMDSPMSHFDPSAVRRIEVVKGPYALTWGAGNLSAIKVETQDVFPVQSGPAHGTITSGYDQNHDAEEVAGSFFGELSDHVSYWVHGAWRQGDDYRDGSGVEVPADFVSGEVRGKLGFRLGGGSRLSLSAGYQDQGEIDYPGRLLDAQLFETLNLAARFEHRRGEGVFRGLDVLAYLNNVDHMMDNDEKPTAMDAPNRTPPFALQVIVDAEVDVSGGRAAVALAPNDGVSLEVGGDVYRARRDALRTISRRSDGMVLFEDLMWPNAVIADGGFFARATTAVSRAGSLAGTVRLDLVRASADTASDFFLSNVGTDLVANETHLSGAVTLTAAASSNWSVSLGLGSAVRTADALERYSDRIPASKAQTSAEFVGNPALDPERSTQGDLWVEANYPRVSFGINAFVRRLDNYITLRPTTLSKRLPLSPDVVFQYINGEADFWGFETTTAVALLRSLIVNVGTHYLRGVDKTVDEPALGVAPFGFDAGLRYERADGLWYADGTVHAVAEQNRVATTRGEVPTDAYATLDLRAGVRPFHGVEFRGGVLNVADKQYVNHLNARNPFTGLQVPEPGRVFFIDVSYAF